MTLDKQLFLSKKSIFNNSDKKVEQEFNSDQLKNTLFIPKGN